MKKIVGSVVTLAALVVGSYYGTGLVTERTLKKNIDTINLSSGLSVEMSGYDRGLFTSKAKLTWQFQTPERSIKNAQGEPTLVPSQTITFDMPIFIYHGPVIYAAHGIHFGLGYANSQLTLPEAYQAKFAEYFNAESTTPKLDLSFFVTYLDETRLHIDVPAFHLVTKKDNSRLEWLGLVSDHRLSPTMSHVDGDLLVNGVRVTTGNRVAVLDKVTFAYDLKQSSMGLFLGKVSVNIPSLVVTEKEKPRFEMMGFEASTSSDVNQDLFDTSFHASFDKMLRHDKTYGPGQVELSIKNLDAAVLADMNEKTNEIQEGPEAERQQALLALLPDLPKLLNKGAAIELTELHVVMPDGAMDGKLSVTLPKGETGNPFQLIQKIEGTGNIKVPVALFKTLLTHSVKNKLVLQSTTAEQPVSGPQEAASVMTSEPATPTTTAPSPASSPQGPTPVIAPAPAPAVDLDQQAAVEADKKIADLIKAGALVQDGTEYVVDVKLVAGQFSVNGHPFNAGMLQF